MAKQGRKFGSIDNVMGNLLGMGDGSQAYRAQVNSKKGYYYIEFNRRYRKVSELDISLKESYAIELVSKHTGINEKFLRLQEKKVNVTETSLDSVYYVLRGTAVIGKMSISVRRYGELNELVFIYQKKNLRPKTSIGRTKSSDAPTKVKAKSNKRTNNRTRKTKEKRTN